jgi:hypothetical protein
MASPLTFYVQIKQDATSQGIAAQLIAKFAGSGLTTLLNSTNIVHYATLALVPNPATKPGVPAKGNMGLLLLTDFDLAMIPYLDQFFGNAGINDFLAAVALIAYNPVPSNVTTNKTVFENFIVNGNLSPAPPSTSFATQYYQAYSQSVKQIKNAFPPTATKAAKKK